MKREYLLFLASLTVLMSAVTACGEAASKPDPKGSEKVTVSDTGTAAETEEKELYPDNLPETDLGEYEFRIFAVEQERDIDTVFSEAETGSILSDAIYRKIRNVEERFNCQVKLISDGTNYSNSIKAGDDEYDICCDHDITMAAAALDGQFLNLHTIPHLDFSQPWWPSASVESLSLGDQMYLFSNHITTCGMHETRVVYFNKRLFEANDFDMPYQMVYDHKWTLDAMYEISRLGYYDLNGDGQKDAGDQYGFVDCGSYYAILEPFNLEPYADVGGKLEWQFDVAKWQPLVEKLYNIHRGEGSYHTSAYDDRITFFAEDRVFFAYAETYCANNFLGDTKVRYGVLPMPLLDESQDKYYSGRTDRPYGVPKTADGHIETTGLLIEALSAEGYREVYPAYFELTMKSRYSDAQDDAKMFDIIMENSILSFTYMFGSQSPYNSMLSSLFPSDSTDVASYAARIEKTQIKYLDRINGIFEDLKNEE